MADSIKLTIQRFDPTVDEKPYTKDYEIPTDQEPDEIWSVLKCLRYINQNIEPVAYDYNCRWGGCGRCGVMVDGIPKLACWARVNPGESHTVEPLSGFPVVRDLVVDNANAYDRFVQADLSIKTYQPMTEVKELDPDVWWGNADGSDEGMTEKCFNRCRECMSCYTVCTALKQGAWDKFVGPGAMMEIAARYLDTEDQSDRLSQAVFSGVFSCVQCGLCTQVCPAHIDIKAVNKRLMDDAIAKGLVTGDEEQSAVNPFL